MDNNNNNNSLKDMSTSLRNSSSSREEEQRQERAETNVPVEVNEDNHNQVQNSSSPSSSSSTFALRLLLGQLLALCIALTGLFSSLLATKKSSIALLQSCTAYAMIFIFAAPVHYRYSSREHSVKMYEQQVAERRENNTPQQQQQRPADSENMNLISSSSNSRGNNNNQSREGIFQVGIPGYFHAHFPLWRYFALACCDVAASFFAIKAYSYTDITSAQLLDAATIFTVMLLGYFFLRRRFNLRHVIGLVFALAGMVGLVFLDATDRSRDSDKTAPDAVLGDALTLIGSCLYGVTNIGCESLLKAGRVALPSCCRCCGGGGSAAETTMNETATNVVVDQEQQQQRQNNNNNEEEEEEQAADDEGTTKTVKEAFHLIVEYVTFISFFGFFISFILMLALSLDEIKTASNFWDWKATMFQIAFCCVMVATYVGLPSLLKLTNATFTALSLLTADAYAVVLNYVTTGVAPKGLYYLCAVVILIGVLIFDTAETSKKKLKKSCGWLMMCC